MVARALFALGARDDAVFVERGLPALPLLAQHGPHDAFGDAFHRTLVTTVSHRSDSCITPPAHLNTYFQ
jgi:hypothetical protein